MRKLYFSLFISVFYTVHISARPQVLDTSRIYIGTSHGVIGSMVFFNPTIDQGFLFGYNGGLLFSYESQKNRFLQIELNFSQRGWKENASTYNFIRRLNYIEVPFLAQYYFGKKSGFILNIGPKISFLVSDKILENTFLATDNMKIPAQHKDIKNKFNYGIILGMGYRFSIKRNIFQFELRGNYSFYNIFSNKGPERFAYSNHINIAANLGWMIRVK